jgi:hypothetical protein
MSYHIRDLNSNNSIDAQGFGDLFHGGASLKRQVGVDRDAAIALCGDGDGERDELAGLLIELAGLGVGVAQRHVIEQRGMPTLRV